MQNGKMTELVSTKSSMIVVTVMPRDGNCLFAAIVHQHFHIDVSSPVFGQAVKEFRSNVVQHIQRYRYMLKLRNCVISRITDEFPHLAPLDYEDKSQFLIDYLSRQGNWGGEEVIVAATEMLGVGINVFHESGGEILFEPRNVRSIRTLDIVFRLAEDGPTHNHYDSFLSDFDEVPVNVLPSLITRYVIRGGKRAADQILRVASEFQLPMKIKTGEDSSQKQEVDVVNLTDEVEDEEFDSEPSNGLSAAHFLSVMERFIVGITAWFMRFVVCRRQP